MTLKGVMTIELTDENTGLDKRTFVCYTCSKHTF